MTGPKNYYGLPVTLSLISQNTFGGGVFDSLNWLTINTNHVAFNDKNYLYIPAFNVTSESVQWAILKIRLSDLAFQLFLSYDCAFPFTVGQFNTAFYVMPRGNESFYFSCPAVAHNGGNPAFMPFIVSTRRNFVSNEIVRMNTLFLTDADIYPCIGIGSSFGIGVISDGSICLEITCEPFSSAYTRSFYLGDILAQTINHGMSGLIGDFGVNIPEYLHIPQNNAHWGIGDLNENLLWQNGNYELCAQITDQSSYTYYMNYGVPIIGPSPSKCNAVTFSSVSIREQNGFARHNGTWPVTGKDVNMYEPIPDLGLRGFSCCSGFYASQNCIFISKNGFILPVIVNDLDNPCYTAYTEKGLIVVGQRNIMLYNFPTLDFDLYKYMPASPITKVGVSLSNMARPVSPLGAFRT